jgi:hypothetical protein
MDRTFPAWLFIVIIPSLLMRESDHQPVAFCHIRVRIIRKDALRACL